ncbi:MAG TPA: response regulator [Bacteroidota bacterium]|nr:response regulator [Bacteroidota bacterium]
MNVLIVDDESSYRMLLRHALEEERWTVFEAGNGAEGMDLLHDEKIDIIISDVYMPVMDGIKFHKNVRATESLQKIPFLFVSAFDDDYTVAVAKDSKSDGFVRKAKPIAFLKEWVRYLTTPEDRRPLSPPVENGRSKPDRSTDRGRGNARTPII